jgi:hypothetical protein
MSKRKRMSKELREAVVACSRLSVDEFHEIFEMLCAIGGFGGDCVAAQFAALIEKWGYAIPKAMDAPRDWRKRFCSERQERGDYLKASPVVWRGSRGTLCPAGRREARRRVVEDANRLRKPADQSEQPSDPDPIEELLGLVWDDPHASARVAWFCKRPAWRCHPHGRRGRAGEGRSPPLPWRSGSTPPPISAGRRGGGGWWQPLSPPAPFVAVRAEVGGAALIAYAFMSIDGAPLEAARRCAGPRA